MYSAFAASASCGTAEARHPAARWSPSWRMSRSRHAKACRWVVVMAATLTAGGDDVARPERQQVSPVHE
jgi:hypothetical protein